MNTQEQLDAKLARVTNMVEWMKSFMETMDRSILTITAIEDRVTYLQERMVTTERRLAALERVK